MRMYDIIKKKRDGGELSDEEIRFFVDGYVSGSIPDYQVSALLMAIYFVGMSERETATLTFAVRDSGATLEGLDVGGVRADKHSTGGVGDKTSLAVMPIVAACGVKVAKMSGRGLGHTGGTVDKLEAIEGFNTALSADKFAEVVKRVGVAIVGQSATLAPADKLLYALRDVTATVDSIPLIASSIMGKKLAACDDCIVLDVKCGSGAFMKTVDDAKRLASAMVDIGKRAGKKISALITDMDIPLGKAIGNSLEVIEAIDVLKGCAPEDLTRLCLALSAEILWLCGLGSKSECEEKARQAVVSGRALDTLAAMVEAQGGNKKWIYDTSFFPQARFTKEVYAPKSGYITSVNAEEYGGVSLLLGAGRSRVGEGIDCEAGIVLCKKTGDYVNQGEAIAVLHSGRDCFAEAEAKLLAATIIGDKPTRRPLILDRVE